MGVDEEISSFKKIKRGVRQGCMLFPDLFSLYNEIVMQNLEKYPGIMAQRYQLEKLSLY